MTLRTPPSWLQNGSHPAENDRLTTQALYATTGIIGATSLAVTQNGTPNMSVNIAAGWAAILGTFQTNMGAYVAYNDATVNAAIATAPSSNSRIDLVCLTVNDAFYSGATNNIVVNVVTGTVAASPVAPATPTNSIALAQVLVGTSVTSIVTANITDVRAQVTTNLPVVTATGAATLTNKTLTSPVINGGVLNSLIESANTVAAAATGTINFDVSTSSVWYYTTSASANFTLNFRGNSGTTLNTLLANNQAVTCVFINTNGATPYYASAVTIDGTSVTPKWQGGTAPTAGNASALDVYSYTIYKTASATYTILASVTKFA
jgi:hypothetical protein